MESKPASCDCVVASNDVMLTYLLQVIVDRYYDSGDSIGAVFSSIEADSALVCACCAVNALPRYIINHNLLSRWQLLPGVYHCQRTHNSESTSSLGTKQINKAT